MKHFPYKDSEEAWLKNMPTEGLRKKFPKVLKKTKMGMISVGYGWSDLVYGLLMGMEKLRNEDKKVKFWVLQIKEKFGTLRVYLDFKQPYGLRESQEIDALILAAERLSAKTCEITGKEGRLYEKGGWLKTLCPEIAEKHGWIPSVNADEYYGEQPCRSAEKRGRRKIWSEKTQVSE